MFCKRFHICSISVIHNMRQQNIPWLLPQSTAYYYIGARDDEVWCHLSLMPLIIDDYSTTCRCCGRKGDRWYNGRYVNTRSISPAKTLPSRKSAQNRCRSCVVGRIGHYLVVIEGVVRRSGFLFDGCMSLSCLSTVCISSILCIIHRIMPHPIIYCYIGARDNLVWRYWYVMPLIIDGSVMMCRRWEQKKQILLI